MDALTNQKRQFWSCIHKTPSEETFFLELKPLFHPKIVLFQTAIRLLLESLIYQNDTDFGSPHLSYVVILEF